MTDMDPFADVAHDPGAKKPDPIIIADGDRATIRRSHRRRCATTSRCNVTPSPLSSGPTAQASPRSSTS